MRLLVVDHLVLYHLHWGVVERLVGDHGADAVVVGSEEVDVPDVHRVAGWVDPRSSAIPFVPMPVGSRVELSTGEIAIVLRQSTVRRLKPKVLVITGPDKVPLKNPTTLDLLYLPPDQEAMHIVRGLPAASQKRDATKTH